MGEGCSSASPRVSVLMTVFNGATLLREGIDSVLAQSFRDFELVVVDDASTDETPAMLAGYDDPRLRLFRAPRNLGLVGARNFGFARLAGAYVAALDHDDLSSPDRLATQVAHLDAHPATVLVGSDISIAEAGRLRQDDDLPCPNPALGRWLLHVDNPLTWSSVMLRRSAIDRLEAFLRPEAEYAEDFDLYHRLLALGDIVRLPVPLTVYRHHEGNTSQARKAQVTEAAAAVLARAYRPWFGAGTQAAAWIGARHLAGRLPVTDRATLARLRVVLERVLAGFCADFPPDPETRQQIEASAARLWWRHARAVIRSGSPAAIRDWRAAAGLRRGFTPPPADIAQSLTIGALRAGRGTRVGQ